jgi:hypothetical protein
MHGFRRNAVRTAGFCAANCSADGQDALNLKLVFNGRDAGNKSSGFLPDIIVALILMIELFFQVRRHQVLTAG